MATFDQLPAEQRAIVELVLQRGRSYEALSDTLQIETSRVRELARDALTELSPVTADRVDPQWRGQVADYLLGQQSGPESTATRGHLKRSEPARTWALSLLDSLDALYANGSRPAIPEIEDGAAPARGRRRGGRSAAVREREPAPAPAPAPAPEPEPEPRRERERERQPLRAEARPKRPLSDEARAALLRRRIIGGVVGGLIFVGVVLGILALTGAIGSSGGGKKKTAAKPAAAQPKIVGQVPLKPVGGAKASGNAFILQRGNQRLLVVQAQLPPLPSNQKKAAYEVWLYNSRTDAASVGAQYTDAKGAYQGAGPLPANFGRFRFVDISREPFDTNTAHSGNSVLRGAFADLRPVAQPSAGGAGTTPGGTGTTPGGTGTTPGGTGTTP